MSEIKYRPILFNSQMVQALLAGKKTQTRRVVKPGPPPCQTTADAMYAYRHGWRYAGVDYAFERDLETCPYGKPGDRLWVREAMRITDCGLVYGVDKAPIQNMPEGWENIPRRPHVTAMFMPRWASRITLEITEVRVQRLQEIGEEDAITEGVESVDQERDEHDLSICPQCGGTGLYTYFSGNGGACFDTDCTLCDTHLKRYKHLWNSINGLDSWHKNPWVWAVSFKATPNA
jgi:hypothetical protein